MRKTACLFIVLIFGFASCCFASSSDIDEAKVLFSQGVLYENGGELEKALEKFKKVMELDPSAIFVYSHTVRVYVSLKQYKEALSLAEILVDKDSKNVDNWILYANVLWVNKDIDGAKKAYKKALKIDDTNVEALHELSLLLTQTDPQEAIKYLKLYARVSPENSPRVYYQLALISFFNKKNDEAVDYLNKSMEVADDFTPSKYLLADFYETQGDLQKALDIYKRILPYEPENANLHVKVGEIYFSLKDEETAKKHFEKAKDIEPSNPGACAWLAGVAEGKKEYESAIGYLRESSDFDTNPKLWLRVSYDLTFLDKLDEAVSLLKKAHEKWPDDTEISYYYALGLDDTGESKKSLEILKNIVKADPENVSFRMQYAVIAEKENEMDIAEENFKFILSKNPDDAMVLNYLGYSLADRGIKLDKAKEYVEKAIRISPEGAYIDSLGWIYFKQGNYEQALVELKKAVGLDTDDNTIWEHLGETYSKLNENKLAWYCFKISLGVANKSSVYSKILDIEKKLSKTEREEYYKWYLKKTSGRLNSFSALCKVNVKSGKRNLDFDGVIDYKGENDIALNLYGPMFTPVLKARLFGGDKFVVDAGDVSFEVDGKFKDNLKKILKILDLFYSSNAYGTDGSKFVSRQSKRIFFGDNAVVYLNSNSSKISALRLSDSKKPRMIFNKYQREKNRFFAREYIINDIGVSITITLHSWKADFNDSPNPLPF
jgi:tetratricopeptide (TPR) repeat protein